MAKLKFIDLFAGLGGFHLALEKLGCECVFASEIQPELQSLYERNFGMKCSGDINEIDITKDIPDHDTQVQLASAKIAICLKNSSFGVEKLSFFLGRRFNFLPTFLI